MNHFRRVAGSLLLQPRFVAAAGGPAELAADSFARANENPLGSPWVQAPNWSAFHLTDSAIGGASGSVMYYSGVSWPDNQYAKLRWTGAGTPNGGPAVRINAANGSCYFAASYSDGTLSIYLWTLGGGYQLLAQQPIGRAWAAADVTELRANGTSLTAYLNGGLIASATDATLASGNAGAFIFPVADRHNAWSAGSL